MTRRRVTPSASYLVVIALLLCLTSSLFAVSVFGSYDEASEYTDCDSCVENGHGWSWSKNECGAYANTNCDPDSPDALYEEEEDYLNQQQHQEEEEAPFEIPPPAPIPSEPIEWANTEATTRLWQLAHAGDLRSLAEWAYREPTIVHLRAEDGRSVLHWANEYEKWEMVDFLKERGADESATDAMGNRPDEMIPQGAKRPSRVPETLDREAAQQAAKDAVAQIRAMRRRQH